MASPKNDFEDDGRVIVDMNVDGMRRREKPSLIDRLASNQHGQSQQMTPSQARQYTRYSLLAVGLIVLVYSATWILFTLFCIYVWFR